MGVISKLMKMNENIAGVTLLAFGNGAADICTSVIGSVYHTELMFNELLGSAMYACTFIAGLVVSIRPFYMQKYEFLRDAIFLLGAVIWVHFVMNDKTCTLLESLSKATMLFMIIG